MQINSGYLVNKLYMGLSALIKEYYKSTVQGVPMYLRSKHEHCYVHQLLELLII